MTHTPGPWRSPYELGEHADEEDLLHFTAPDGQSVIGVGWWDGPYLSVTEENARLIAAAPDLLEALEELRAAVLADGNHEPADVPAALRKAGAALNRARGAS